LEKDRLTAFSDGVIAIIITIMVLELRPPHGADWGDLLALGPKFLSYALSFLYVAIYWNNHHHMLQAVDHVNGTILWANTHLLFWLSLVPFTTAWMAESDFATAPVATYGLSLLAPAIAYTLLTKALIGAHGADSTLASAIGSDVKGKASIVIYAFAVAMAFYLPFVSIALYATVAAMWFAPDRRIEHELDSSSPDDQR
jgi:uncharacterized membrane protein